MAKEAKNQFWFRSTRFNIFFLLFIGRIVTNGAQFAVLNLSLICIVNSSEYQTTSSNNSGECGSSFHNSSNSRLSDKNPQFNWDKTIQSSLLAGYSWGCLFAFFFVASSIDRFGMKTVMLVSSSMTTISTLLGPALADWGWIPFFISRFLTGFGVAQSAPTLMKMCTMWASKDETGGIIGMVTSGYLVGNMLALASSGYMCSAVGWQYSFYLYGAAGAIWVVAWAVFFTDWPEKNRFVSDSEKKFIIANRLLKKADSVVGKVPWQKIISTPQIVVLFYCYGCHRYNGFFAAQFMPSYFKTLNINIEQNGILSAVPFLAQAVGRLLSGTLSDKITIVSKIVSVKVSSTIGFGVSAIVLLALSFLGCGQAIQAEFMFILYFMCFSFLTAGYLKCLPVMAPKHSASIAAISGFIGSTTAAVMPYAVGRLTYHETIPEWRHAFYLSSSLLLSANIIFLLFGSIETVGWASKETETITKVTKF